LIADACDLLLRPQSASPNFFVFWISTLIAEASLLLAFELFLNAFALCVLDHLHVAVELAEPLKKHALLIVVALTSLRRVFF